MLNWAHSCTSWDIFCEKMKNFKKIKNIESSFRLWFCVENLARNWSKFEISCKFEKNMKNFMMCQWNIFCEKWKIWKTVKTIKKSFRLWFYAENLARNWTKFEFSCKFEKIWKTSWCVNLYIMKHLCFMNTASLRALRVFPAKTWLTVYRRL